MSVAEKAIVSRLIISSLSVMVALFVVGIRAGQPAPRPGDTPRRLGRAGQAGALVAGGRQRQRGLREPQHLRANRPERLDRVPQRAGGPVQAPRMQSLGPALKPRGPAREIVQGLGM